MKTLAYIRVSTSRQDMDGQRLEILDYARAKKLHIDDFIEIEVSSRLTQKQRRIEELLSRLVPGDTLLVSELSRLGRSTPEVIVMVNEMARKGISFIAIKQGIAITADHLDMQSKITVTLFSLMAELERDLISARTKQGLAARKQAGVKLGKPKGTIQPSKLDDKVDAIKELLKHRVSRAAIARMMKCSRTCLNSYIASRGIIAEG